MDTVFEREILSQGRLLGGRADDGRKAAERAPALADSSVTQLVTAVRGSSDHAATYLHYLAGQHLGRLSAFATPLLFVDPIHVNLAGAVVVGFRSPERV